MELKPQFIDGAWSENINVTDFVYKNLTPYEGDASFLVGPTQRTQKIWNLCLEALEEERSRGGVRSFDPDTVSTITSHKAGYIDRENELIVGLQTDELLRRAIKPFGGIKVVEKACAENGKEVNPKVKDIFTHYRKTHNDGVFDVYTEEIRRFRSLGFLTGLPDNYARGRIIGDYRRLALYGIDRLIEAKQNDLRGLTGPMTEARIRTREEVADQIKEARSFGDLSENSEYDEAKNEQGKLYSRIAELEVILPRRCQGTGRCRHVAGQRFFVPGHLYRARPEAQPHRRNLCTGAD